jgi:putative thioredoxin
VRARANSTIAVNDSLSLIYDVDEASFDEKVLKASARTPVLVDFWADWCPPCVALTPVLEKVAAEYGGKVRLAKVEADENMKLAGRYGLRGFPTVLLFVDGEERDRFSSFRPADFVRDFIDRQLPAA